MMSLVPGFVWPVILAASVALVALVGAAIRRHGRSGAATAVASLAAWLAAATLLSAAGAFAASGGPPTIAIAVLAPVLAGGLALALSPAARARAVAIPQPWLVGIQSLRVVGFVFLVLLARGALPRQFALPAGWGDVAVGAAAPLVAWALARRKPWAARLAAAWNALGLLDLAVAVIMGALSAEGPIRVFSSGPSTEVMGRLPLSLIPAFGVPLFALLHVASLVGLASRRGRPAVPAPSPRSRSTRGGGASAGDADRTAPGDPAAA